MRDLVLWPDFESVEGDALGHGVDGQPLLRDLLAQPTNLVVPPLAQLQCFKLISSNYIEEVVRHTHEASSEV